MLTKKAVNYSEESFKNPTPELRKDLGWKLAYIDWLEKTNQLVVFDSAEEAIDYLSNSENAEWLDETQKEVLKRVGKG